MNGFSPLSLFHRSAFVRLAVRGVVFAAVTYALVDIALKMQGRMTSLSLATVILVTALVIIEAILFVLVKTIFKNVS
jgi:hypothetical protein